MIFHVLACDYDGTVAENGRMPEATARALQRVRESGRKVSLVTGRTLPDLQRACPDCDQIFDVIVAENGALLYHPKTQEMKTLGAAPEEALLRELQRRGVAFDVGTSSIHTAASAAEPVLAAIRATGVDRMPVFNRGALMLLPGGITKGTGLSAALEVIGTSVHNTAGVGDGENDHAFLAACEYAVAVADAVAALRERADYVTRASGPRGVAEFIQEQLLHDVPEIRRVPRHGLRIGQHDGQPVSIAAHGTSLLVVGPSRSGKSTLAGILIERLVESGRSVCVIDPEGDYDSLAELRGVIALGGKGEHTLPTANELEQVLRKGRGLVLNLSRLSRAEKVAYGTEALTVVTKVLGATGMPHWVVIDEAHHLLPAEGSPAAEVLGSLAEGLCLVTLEVTALASAARRLITALASPSVEDARTAVQALGWSDEPMTRETLGPGEMLLVCRETSAEPVRFQPDRRRREHRRHVRKYAEGELPPDRSFYFRGPVNALNLRAANLARFTEIAEGVDEATWEHHLARGDYSAWFRQHIKDPDLAQAAEAVEAADGPPSESRRRLLNVIRERYST